MSDPTHETVIRNYLVRNTHDFIISDRKVGFGFGVVAADHEGAGGFDVGTDCAG